MDESEKVRQNDQAADPRWVHLPKVLIGGYGALIKDYPDHELIERRVKIGDAIRAASVELAAQVQRVELLDAELARRGERRRLQP